MLRKFLIACAVLALTAPVGAREVWTRDQANSWYGQQKWLVGANYINASSINQLEMWQAESFNPAEIDRELGWAQAMGLNTMRVFLHDALWAQDAAGYRKRIDTFLAIAARHNIKPLLVLFDSCWDPHYQLGPQHPPIPGVHNSGWVQGPGAKALNDPAQEPRLQAYVKGVVGAFANDKRVVGWDVWNEPDNPVGQYADDVPAKIARVAVLLPRVYDWARSVNPTQPLTSGVWHDAHWDKLDGLNPIEKTQLTQSDVISFHDYSWPETFEARATALAVYGRPVICTEYMARGAGSTFDTILPIGKRRNIGMINWGFVNGKTQTDMPWDSWQRPYTLKPPTLWFHDIFRRDGTAYRAREAELIKKLSAAPKSVVPAME